MRLQALKARPRRRRLPFDHTKQADEFLVVFTGGDHMIFSGRRFIVERPADAHFHELIEKVSRAFWDAYLKGDSAARQWLTGNGFATELGKDGTWHKVWTNTQISIPSLVTRMSLPNGLISTYTKPAGPGTTDPWYFAAVDYRTGQVAWKQLAGTGLLYDHNCAGSYVGANGALSVGVNGGIVAMMDAS